MSNRFVVGGRTNKREEAIHNLEIARRQRLLPVQCWEKQWVTPQGALSGSTYKVYKWVKTDKVQEFSDDEVIGSTNEQLAPERDEIEALEGAVDQEIEELEAADRDGGEEEDSRAVSEDPTTGEAKPRTSGTQAATGGAGTVVEGAATAATTGTATPLENTTANHDGTVPGISLLPPSPSVPASDGLPGLSATASPSPAPTPISDPATPSNAMEVTSWPGQ